mmetsp:Transcript_8051/g.25247  ORF Transcript_8051/g.25247 Transcript_8051/m.25247 type:complete len:523 (+) Transcript_8051:2-1570(+)
MKRVPLALVVASLLSAANGFSGRRLQEQFETLRDRMARATPSEQLRIEAAKARALPTLQEVLVPAEGLERDLPTDVDCKVTQLCDFGMFCRDVCAAGSVVVPGWQAGAIRTQRELQMNLPLNEVFMLGTHNSAITYANGLGMEDRFLTNLVRLLWPHSMVRTANQLLSLTDQLNMGVRQLELDIHYHNGDIRLCHAGGVHLAVLNKLVKELSAILGVPIDWDSETLGCFGVPDELPGPHEWHMPQALVEIRTWLERAENADEVLVIMLDDQEDLLEWHELHLVVQYIDQIWGDMVFTPADKQAGYPEPDPNQPNWPTPRQMLAAGKRLVVTSCTDYGSHMSSYIFYKYNGVAQWDESGPSAVAPYPSCSFNGGRSTATPFITRVLADSTWYGPFKPADELEVNATVLAGLTKCDVRYPCMDQATPAIAEGSIWTWAPGEPRDVGNCTLLSPDSGRWHASPCVGVNAGMACANATDPHQWVVGTGSSCPEGFAPRPPRNGYESAKLVDVAREAGTHVWIPWSP